MVWMITPKIEVAPHFTELSDAAVDDFGSFWSLCVIIFIHVISFGYEGDKFFLEVFMITVEARSNALQKWILDF